MKESKLLADANLQIKIERGLKMLEFATQYNLRKAYYRSSCVNIFGEDEKSVTKSKAGEKHALVADIINELNQDILASPASQLKAQKYLKVPERSLRINESSASQYSKSNSYSSDQSQSLSYKVNESDDPSLSNIQALSNYHSQNEIAKLKSIKEEVSEENSELPPIANKLTSHVISGINFSDLNSISQDHSSSSLFTKKSKRQKVEQPGRASNTNTPAQTKVERPPSFSQKEKKELVIQYSSSHREQLNTHQKRQGQHEYHSQSKSSHHTSSILNHSISAIAMSTDPPLPSHSSTISEFQLLKQLSSSFCDRQNIKTLLRLQNCEMQQQYLERRMVSRLQKGYKGVKQIGNISWQRLHMPRFDCMFNRPNYAHVLE